MEGSEDFGHTLCASDLTSRGTSDSLAAREKTPLALSYTPKSDNFSGREVALLNPLTHTAKDMSHPAIEATGSLACQERSAGVMRPRDPGEIHPAVGPA